MSRLTGLDTLRALAILAVMMFHATGRLPESLQPLAQFGWMGVDLFFVLSGFLIGTQLLRPYARAEKPQWADFYERRAFRVLPAYLAVLLIYLTVPGWREADHLSPVWEFLTLTENLFVDYRNNQAFSHVWSLCIEEHFYLLLPLLSALVMRSRHVLRTTILIALGIISIGIAIRADVLIHVLHPIGPAGDDFGLLYIERIYYPTYTRLDGLLFGVLLAVTALFLPGWWNAIQRRAGTALTVGIVLVGMSIWLFRDRFSSDTGSAAWAIVIGFPLLALGLTMLVASATAMKLHVPGSKTTALLAYSLYLTHKEVLNLVANALPEFTASHRWLSLGLYIPACFAVAAILYFAVELPFLRMRDHRSRRRAELQALVEPAT